MNIFPVQVPIFATLAIAVFVRKLFFYPEMSWSFFVIAMVIALLGDVTLILDW